jgi:glutamyl-tRNA reductase
MSRAIAEPARRDSTIWVLAAHAGTCTAEERINFARTMAARGETDRPDRLLLVTCHRAELYGSGPVSEPRELASSVAGSGKTPRLRLLEGRTAINHTLRLAAGLESAVIGEDQILHQIRELRQSARSGHIDPVLTRLLEVAISVGRRARATRSAPSRSDVSLAVRSLDWLSLHGSLRSGGRLLVVGSGRMGRLLALEARARNIEVTIASRHVERAVELAQAVSGRGVGLEEAARIAPSQDAVALALSGLWVELPAGVPLPPVVDLSAPPSIAPRGNGPHLDIDGLGRWNEAAYATPEQLAYEVTATALTEQTAALFERWLKGRPSVDAVRALRDSAERNRAAEFERLMRRLPDLEPRERDLIGDFSKQLVAGLLHGPTSRLRDDANRGAATAPNRPSDI